MTHPPWLPETIHVPQTAREVGELVRQARGAGQAVFPLGGRTMLDLGPPPSRAGMAIDLTRLKEVVDHPARDMTVTVQAGMTMDALAAVLAREHQRLPVDVPHPGQATLGGAIACNASGPRRFSMGTLRDYVIGITVINDDGQETRAGGRVVKNVAGYDLCKLYVGSLGTLGIITQATLKLRPLPEAFELVEVDCPRGDQLESLLETSRQSRSRPASLALLNREAARALPTRAADKPGHKSAEWLLVVGLEECKTTLRWQAKQLQQEMNAGGWSVHRTVAQHQTPATWSGLRDFPLAHAGFATIKAAVPSSATAGFCQAASARLGEHAQIMALPGNGIVWIHLDGACEASGILEAIATLRRLAGAARGSLTWTRCPESWRTSAVIWGESRGDEWLMREVKRQFDPDDLFNPGRYVGGI